MAIYTGALATGTRSIKTPSISTAAVALIVALVASLLVPLSVATPAGAVDIVEQVVWGKRSGETWRYAPSSQVGDLGASMAAPDFDDSAWSNETFRYVAGPGSGQAFYFRKDFEIDELFKVVGIEVEFQYDDAAVLYLNGTEVYRTIRGNLPDFDEVPLGGDIPANVNVPYGGAENQYIMIPGSNSCEQGPCSIAPVDVAPIDFELLNEGTNTWAVSLWNRTGSTDVSLDHEFRLVIDRDATALEIDPVSDQTNQLADDVSLQLSGESPNPGPITWEATGLPDGLTINQSSGLISGMPTAIGTFSVEITADDGVRPATTSLTWEVVNAPPEIDNPGPQQTSSFSPVNLTIAAVDPDGGDLTFAAEGLPPGIEINTSTGVITGSSSAEDSYTVNVTVTDDENASAMVTFSWQIAEPPIDIVNPGPQTSTFGVNTSLALMASDPAGGNVVLSIDGLPPGLSLDPQTNVVSGTPTMVGEYSIILTGVGPSGRSIISFPWAVPNLEPDFDAIGDQVALVNVGVDLTITAADPDGGDLVFAADGLPPGLTIDTATGAVTGVPSADGVFSVAITATDDEGAPTVESFSWQVFAAIDQPFVINEFMSSNDTTLLDEDEDSPDWFELRSLAPVALSLEGWVIQDGAAGWTFPDVVVPAGGYLLVFASDKDRDDPASELHTNFKLSKEMDTLTLIDPGGFVIDEFAGDDYPPQFADVSYGRANAGSIFYLDSPTPNAANTVAGSNYAPVLRPFTDRIYNVGEPVSELIDAFDPDMAPVSYSLNPLPPGLSVNITTGEITGTATTAGVFNSEVLAIDVENKRQSQAVRWIFVPEHTGPTRLAMNEYNAVAPDRPLIAGADPAFGLVAGNGGDWYEFVVVEDGLDLRGWSIELWDQDHTDDLLDLSTTLVFADSPELQSLPAGLIITVSEDRPDDLTYDPAAGDWHINLQSNDADEGAHFTADSQENFNSTRSGQNVLLFNAAGGQESPAVGETELWDQLVGGVGGGEVMSLCIDPTSEVVDGITSYLDNGTFSSYGQPNSCIFVNDPLDPDDDVQFDQNLDALRNSAVLVSAEFASSCAAEDGTFTFMLGNTSGSTVQFALTISTIGTILRGVQSGTIRDEAISGFPDGTYQVAVNVGGVDLLSQTVEVACDADQPTPTPTPDPPPATAEVLHVVSCLAGNGRVDTNIVNTGSASADYRLEFEGLSPRQLNVAAGDWWRMPITGRPDRAYAVTVKRDGVVVSQQAVQVSCDTSPPVVSTPEVQVVNACRGGNGYLLFQFVNQTAAQRSWVIEFEGVPNRSTSAGAYAQSVRAVTGRQDGTYGVAIRANGVVSTTFDVTVDCD